MYIYIYMYIYTHMLIIYIYIYIHTHTYIKHYISKGPRYRGRREGRLRARVRVSGLDNDNVFYPCFIIDTDTYKHSHMHNTTNMIRMVVTSVSAVFHSAVLASRPFGRFAVRPFCRSVVSTSRLLFSVSRFFRFAASADAAFRRLRFPLRGSRHGQFSYHMFQFANIQTEGLESQDHGLFSP